MVFDTAKVKVGSIFDLANNERHFTDSVADVVEFFTALKQQPKFELLGDAYFLPRPSKPGDAGHDLKAYIPLALTNNQLKELSLARFTEPVYINGESFDINAQFEELVGLQAVVIYPGQVCKISAGFKVAMPILPKPFVNVMQIVARSGFATKHQLCVVNSPGIVDSGYRGEVIVALENRSKAVHIITHSTRIAQALFQLCTTNEEVPDSELVVAALDTTARGAGGFGHTGA